jgi:hypothetical protein
MKLVPSVVLLASIAASGPAIACQPASEAPFDVVAPTANDILAVQVEALVLDSTQPQRGHLILAKIRVLKHYRGSGDFTELSYVNSVAALRSEGDFHITTDAAQQGLSRYGPPPRVPHPDELNDE